MAKITKTQIMHINTRLNEKKGAKLNELRAALPNTHDQQVDLDELGLEWARKNPTKFVELCVRVLKKDEKHNGGYYHNNTNLKAIWEKTPAAEKVKAQHQATNDKNTERFTNAELKLTAEISRIIDELYLGDVEDAKKALADFDNFAV